MAQAAPRTAQFRMDRETHARLRRLAGAEDRTMISVVRKALAIYEAAQEAA